MYKTLIYNTSLALLTDFYQLTMAQGFFLTPEMRNKEGFYYYHFRNNPFEGGFTVFAGLGTLMEILENFRFEDSDIEWLASLTDDSGFIFHPEFLNYLRTFKFTCDIKAPPEGTIVFPHEPVITVKGPLIQAQIIETILLNVINFQSLIATKAARLRLSAGDDLIIDMGLRRAQAPDGALSASRAAYIGGTNATSNTLAAKLFKIPVRGTHAHSWVMAFGDDLEAFKAWAKIMPSSSIFLVDTFDTLEGVKAAIEIGKWLKSQGHPLKGIRLDSGNLLRLSKQSRQLLDEAGLEETLIVASNDLDEFKIELLKRTGAVIGVWGVGTQLVTGGTQAALGGVYKLAAIRDPGGEWEPRMKFSSTPEKASIPGEMEVQRYFIKDKPYFDVIFDPKVGPPSDFVRDKDVEWKRESLHVATQSWPLLRDIFKGGVRYMDYEPLNQIQERVLRDLPRFDSDVRKGSKAYPYIVGLEESLYQRRKQMLANNKKEKHLG